MPRNIAITALLIAFFLPLTKCTTTTPAGISCDDYSFPFENVTSAARDIYKNGLAAIDSIPLAVVTLAVFFVPISMTKMRRKTQSIAHMVLTGPAEWLLYHWTTIGEPQIGGIIAMLSWLALFGIAVASLLRTDAA